MGKIMVPLILLSFMVAPCIAMSEQEAAYIAGINDGFYLGQLAGQARGNATAANLYNTEIAKYNDFMNSTLNASEARQEWLAFLPIPDDSWMPIIVREWNSSEPVWNGANVTDGRIL